MSKHTKGEWRADIESGCVVCDAGMICDVGFMNVNPEAKSYLRYAADARLIAAAPDLLEACENAKILLEEDMRQAEKWNKVEPVKSKYWKPIKKIEAAIAKAEKEGGK